MASEGNAARGIILGVLKARGKPMLSEKEAICHCWQKSRICSLKGEALEALISPLWVNVKSLLPEAEALRLDDAL